MITDDFYTSEEWLKINDKNMMLIGRGNGKPNRSFKNLINAPYGLDTGDDTIDCMKYCYNDILTTQHYIASLSTTIEKVIFNDPATIIIWNDGSKTVVKCSKDESFDPEKGLAMAICKKVLGDRFKACFKQFVPEETHELFTLDKSIANLRNISNTLNKKD